MVVIVGTTVMRGGGGGDNKSNLEVSFFSEAQHCNIVKYCFKVC
jgi:hypothetical protein